MTSPDERWAATAAMTALSSCRFPGPGFIRRAPIPHGVSRHDPPGPTPPTPNRMAQAERRWKTARHRGKGGGIVSVGKCLGEREPGDSRIGTGLQLRSPGRELFFRHMGHVGDTPGFRPHPARVSQWAFPGADKFHPELNTHYGKGFFSTPDQWLTHLKADTIVAFFGYNESFDGPSRVANFEAELDAWVQPTPSKADNRSPSHTP